MAVILPPRTKPPFSVDNITGASITPISSLCRKLVLYMNNQNGQAATLIEFPVGAGFVTRPANERIELIADPGYPFSNAGPIATIKTASGTESFVWEEF